MPGAGWTASAAGASDRTDSEEAGVDSGAMPGSFKMLRSSNKRPGQLRALDRIKDWTRARFKLPEDAAVMVTEVACGLPGCPPLETVVAFWTGTDTRHHFKVFKPVEDVVPDDLPPAWLRNALIAVEGEGLECC